MGKGSSGAEENQEGGQLSESVPKHGGYAFREAAKEQEQRAWGLALAEDVSC